MKWERRGAYGVISEPYRVGKFSVSGHLEYRLWFHDELIGEAKTFEECQAAAEDHAQVMDGRT